MVEVVNLRKTSYSPETLVSARLGDPRNVKKEGVEGKVKIFGVKKKTLQKIKVQSLSKIVGIIRGVRYRYRRTRQPREFAYAPGFIGRA